MVLILDTLLALDLLLKPPAADHQELAARGLVFWSDEFLFSQEGSRAETRCRLAVGGIGGDESKPYVERDEARGLSVVVGAVGRTENMTNAGMQRRVFGGPGEGFLLARAMVYYCYRGWWL